MTTPDIRTALKAEPEGEGEGPSERIISIAKAVQECAFTHEPDARLIGNVCAEDIADLCAAALATPPAPEPGEVGGLHPLWYLVEFLEGHSSFLRRTEPTDELAQILSDSATMLQQQEAELAALRQQPHPTYVAVPVPVAELDDQRREAVHQAVVEALGSEAYDCTRVWEAWSYGTMGPDDFVPVAEDSDRVAEIADAAIEAIRAIPLPVPVAVAECPHCGYEGEMVPAPQAGEVEA
jgi:hypothetical protein